MNDEENTTFKNVYVRDLFIVMFFSTLLTIYELNICV